VAISTNQIEIASLGNDRRVARNDIIELEMLRCAQHDGGLSFRVAGRLCLYFYLFVRFNSRFHKQTEAATTVMATIAVATIVKAS
jgi:hypothetical protein